MASHRPHLPCLNALLAALCFLLLAGCHHEPEKPPSPPGAFNQFIKDVSAAKASDYIGKPGVQVESEAAFEEMKAHILKLYEGVTVSHSFSENAHMVDCIPLEQQPGLRRPGAAREALQTEAPKSTQPPAEKRRGAEAPERKSDTLDLLLKPGVRDPNGQEMICGEGSIPMRRVTLEETTRFKNLRSFFSKGSKLDDFRKGTGRLRGDIPPEDATHYYARGVQYVDNFGADSWLNVWNPTVSDNQFSLSQQWIVGGDGATKQTAEGGWQVYPQKYNSGNAALFIFYTTAGYTDGCYNLDCSGFVQRANNIYLGRGFTNYSSTDGTQWGFNLQWKRGQDGTWWLFYRGPGDYITVGYYPHSLYGNGTLATKATKIAFGGEDTGQASAKQMGSGQKASAGWQKAAYQNMIFYIDTNTTSQWANLDKYESNPDCYTTDLHDIYGNWGTYLFLGGPSCN
jgi:Neprosin